MKLKIALSGVLLLISFYLICCSTLTERKIKQRWWKAGDFCGLPDVLRFSANDSFHLKNDTIFMGKQAVALIIKKEYRTMGDHVLTIQNLTNKAIGQYYAK